MVQEEYQIIVLSVNMQVSQSRQKLWKEWHFISQSMTQPAEVTCMVVVTTRITLL